MKEKSNLILNFKNTSKPKQKKSDSGTDFKASYLKYKKEQALIDPKYKKELCFNFVNRGKCKYNLKCRFAHGEEDLIQDDKNKDKDKEVLKTTDKEFNRNTISYKQELNLEEKSFLNKLNKSYHRLPVFCCITSTERKSTKDNSFENSFTSINSHNKLSENNIQKKGKSKLSILFDK